jgi:hypothetical protein
MQQFNQAFFNKTFILNHETGELKWRVSPPRNPLHKQGVAGCKIKDDSVLITIQKKKFLRHRIIYVMVNGDIEENMEIRHKNRVRGDDRPCNLIAVKKGSPIKEPPPKKEPKQPVFEVEKPIAKLVVNSVKCSDCKVDCKNQRYLVKIVSQNGCPDFKRKGL